MLKYDPFCGEQTNLLYRTTREQDGTNLEDELTGESTVQLRSNKMTARYCSLLASLETLI